MRDEFADDLMAYQNEAEDQFDDFYEEDYEDNFAEGFEGNEDAYEEEFEEFEEYEGYDDFVEPHFGSDEFEDFGDQYDSFVEVEEDNDFDSYKKTSIGKIDANDRTLTIVVTNTSGAAAEAIIFGANEGAAQPAGVTVDVQESSHGEVREESKANPFKIIGMKYSVSNPLQFDNILKIIKRTATGTNEEKVYQPRNATSPQNFTQNLIDDAAFEMSVTGQDSLRLTINDGVTIVFTMTIRARTNMGNLLKGNNVAELFRAPRTTGLPQLDLKRTRGGNAFGIPRKRIRRRPVLRFRPRVRYAHPRRRFARPSGRPPQFAPKRYYKGRRY